mmetsp:Transcript_5725/g.16892  ORF Transcript_5725/g.16892 Transcript_5725/m.16892 type:complete len:108 (-) Transcript_5725:42-365(-)
MASGADLLPVVGIFVLKLTMNSFNQTVNTLKGELFPAAARVTALSASGTCGRLGALLAPAIIEETRGPPGSPGEFDVFLRCLVLVLLTALALSAALLPESKRRPLPS